MGGLNWLLIWVDGEKRDGLNEPLTLLYRDFQSCMKREVDGWVGGLNELLVRVEREGLNELLRSFGWGGWVGGWKRRTSPPLLPLE